MCACSFIPWPNSEGDDFVTKLVALAYVQDTLPAQVNRTTLIMALETHFGRMQILATSWHSQNTERMAKPWTSSGQHHS
jgi:hypothetical protein